MEVIYYQIGAFFCNERKNNGKIQNFIRSTNTSSPTNNSGASVIPPFGTAFMYVETSSNNFGENFFVVGREQI